MQQVTFIITMNISQAAYVAGRHRHCEKAKEFSGNAYMPRFTAHAGVFSMMLSQR